MISCRFSKSLFACALALTGLSAAHARPMVLEERQGISFRDAASTLGDASFLAASRYETPPIALNSPGNHYGFDWDHRDSTAQLNYDPVQVPGRNGYVIPVDTAVPEPSAYVLMMVGFAGIAIVALRRRSRAP